MKKENFRQEAKLKKLVANFLKWINDFTMMSVL